MNKKSQFGKALYEYELLVEPVNLDYYKQHRRKTHHLFPKASEELDVVVINFCYRPIIQIYAHGFALNRKKLTEAITTLVNRGLIQLLKEYSTNGYPRVYQRTEEFEKTFTLFTSRIKVLDKVLVSNKHKISSTKQPFITLPLCGQKQIQNGGNWATPRSNPYEQIKLSLSNGGQIFEDVVLRRVKGKRLYATGMYNYQNIPKEERKKYLLINGQPTTEIDFVALHGNLLLNREGCPSDRLFYEKILRTLGFRNSKKKRAALKTIVCASFNIKSRQAFCVLANRISDDDGNRLIGYLNDIRPIEIYHAIIETHPAISKYICTGDHSDWLQTTDSEIMISILKRLARAGVVALPLHDSCIVTKDNKDVCIRSMKKIYKKHMRFEGKVK
jgi:hypothetical protein